MRRFSFASRCPRSLRLAGAACLLALTAAGQEPARAPHEANVDLVVLNRSRQAITQLYVSASASDQWGDDRLAGATLGAGKSVRIRLRRPADCRIDLQVVYEDESSEETQGFDACATRQVSFDGSNSVSPSSLFSRAHQVTLTNRAGRPVQQVYISPSEADQWGDDRLGQGSISIGDSRSIGYRGPCTSDLRVVFDNGAAEERRSLDLCAMPALIIEPGWTTAERPPVPVAAQAPAAGKVTVDIVNHSGRMVRQLFLFPQGSDRIGPDLLGGSALGAGTRITVDMPRGAGCLYAARVVPGGGVPEWDLTGIDLCRASVVDLPPA
jgi:hypothetical protein